MNTIRVLGAMLQADFLERTRRYSFLVVLGLVLYLGFAVGAGQIVLTLQKYRGIYNSAWIGSLMTLTITFFLGLFGFFLVKNAIERDTRTGVGQIIATTPLTRVQYLYGKWLSNLTVLAVIVGILAVAALLIQFIVAEDTRLDAWHLLAPFLFVALPYMALVAALAVFFEAVPWLRGGFGNLVYFILFFMLLVAGIMFSQVFDALGIGLFSESMKQAAQQTYPDYNGSFTLNLAARNAMETFVWNGLDWTPAVVLYQMRWVVLSFVVVLAGVPFFDRFDPSRSSHRPADGRADRKKAVLESDPLDAGTKELVPAPAVRLTPLAADRLFRWNFLPLVWLELKLLVKGYAWYWFALMALLWIRTVAVPDAASRDMFFALSALAPILVWSKLGEREARFRTNELVFSAPYPILRSLLPSWLAGVVVAMAALSSVLVGRVMNGEPLGPVAWVLAVLFIPTLALALGVWTRSSKVFEIIYVILWYLGPFSAQNAVVELDFLGNHPDALANTSPLLLGAIIVVLFVLAVLGRRQQVVG